MKNYSSFDFQEIFKDSNDSDTKFNFFRRGQIGNWVEYFNEEQSNKVDDIIEKNFKGLIDFKFFASNNEI